MNAIEEMRVRLQERFRGVKEPMKGLDINYFPRTVTQNNAPRLPQSNIPSPKVSYSRPGRPSKTEPSKFKKYWEGWI